MLPVAEVEAKIICEVLCVSQSETASGEFNNILEQHSGYGALRNCRSKDKRVGPLATEEVAATKEWWIKRVQFRDTSKSHFLQTSAWLGL